MLAVGIGGGQWHERMATAFVINNGEVVGRGRTELVVGARPSH